MEVLGAGDGFDGELAPEKEVADVEAEDVGLAVEGLGDQQLDVALVNGDVAGGFLASEVGVN